MNETLEECAIRELKEETNINVNDLELITVLSGKEYYFKYPNEDELDCVIALYKVSNYEGELNINDGESKELKFFSLDNLPELESRAKAIIDKIKGGIIKSPVKIPHSKKENAPIDSSLLGSENVPEKPQCSKA